MHDVCRLGSHQVICNNRFETYSDNWRDWRSVGGKSNPMRSKASERRSVDDLLFNDVYSGQSKPVYDKDILSMTVYDEPVCDEDIFSIPVYDKPVYNKDIFSIPVYDKPVYDEDILSMPVYDMPVYGEDIFNELPGLMSQSSPPSVKFDDATEDEGVVVDGDDIIEIVGQVEGGVSCISPSPDGDLFAIMTGFVQIGIYCTRCLLIIHLKVLKYMDQLFQLIVSLRSLLLGEVEAFNLVEKGCALLLKSFYNTRRL